MLSPVSHPLSHSPLISIATTIELHHHRKLLPKCHQHHQHHHYHHSFSLSSIPSLLQKHGLGGHDDGSSSQARKRGEGENDVANLIWLVTVAEDKLVVVVWTARMKGEGKSRGYMRGDDGEREGRWWPTVMELVGGNMVREREGRWWGWLWLAKVEKAMKEVPD